MMLLVSGEGSSDMGSRSETGTFKPGPMAILVDQFVASQMGDSMINRDRVRFLSKSDLKERRTRLGNRYQSVRLAGPKRRKGYSDFIRWAQVMGIMAKELEAERQRPVVAVLFRDSDGTGSERSKDLKRWKNQCDAMREGFLSVEGYRFGVPMIPKPKSEAWLLCALQKEPYQHCQSLENLSGNDDAAPKNSPKKLLEMAIGGSYNNEEMMDWLKEGRVEIKRINMPSCIVFRSDLLAALQAASIGVRTAAQKS